MSPASGKVVADCEPRYSGDAVVAFFTEVLDFELTEAAARPDGSIAAAFLSFSNKAHDIAFIRRDEPGRLHHVAFWLDSWHEVGQAADIIARYKRLAGFDVHFVMGNDEHSQNVYRKARELSLDPVEYCNRMEREFRSVWSRLDISFDDFIRTTETRHRIAVQTLIERSKAAGDIYDGVYEGWYCISCEAFKQEKDLESGLCPIHQRKPEWIKEKNHFFRLSAYRDRLLRLYEEHPEFVVPESRRNEMLRLLEAGLEDISVSRAGQAW